MCLHELTGTNCLSLHCLHFPLTFGPVLCSSGETVTSVTSMSPLQPKKVKKKKEKEKLEQPPAIPAKGMKTETQRYLNPEHNRGGTAERGTSGILHFATVCASEVPCSCSHLWGKKWPLPASGTGFHLPAALAILRCYSMRPSRRSQLTLTRGERGTSAAIFTLLKEKIKVRQVEITCWGYSEGSRHMALFKIAGALGKSSKLGR